MASKKEGKSQEQILAEKQESAMLIERIKQLTEKVPKSVMEGSYQYAVAWKQYARKGVLLLSKPKPSIDALRQSLAELSKY